MEIKIITKNGEFIDAVAGDCNLLEWAENWIKDRQEFLDIEYWNGGDVILNVEEWGTYLIFSADNGMLELEIFTKQIS
jgi:hypothetical protein